MSDLTPTPPTPGAPEPTNPPAQPTPPVPIPPAAKTPPWGSDENFTPAKAWELIENLRKEKGGDSDALKAQMNEMQQAQKDQQARIAAALGLTEPPKTEDDLTETVKSLQAQFQASQAEATKLRIAAEKGVPAEYHHLLTETDTEKLTTQAEMAAEYARLKAAAAGTPEFVPNPGQGQGGGPATPEAQADAEYAKFYPSSK